jgi:uncharacterized membrane protein
MERLRLKFRHVLYSLRGGFLVRPLTIALTLGCVGAVLSWIEETNPGFSDWVPKAIFLFRDDPQVAQVILGGIAASIMTVVSIVFAILLMSLTLASMQFSPRIIVSFSRDRVTQWTLGIFLGTFLYCIAALPAAHSLPEPFTPVASVTVAILLAIACVGLLLFFIHHISEAISVNHIVAKIASETEAVIDDVMPSPHKTHRLDLSGGDDLSAWDQPVLNDISGYIRYLDTKRLLHLATSYRVKVRVVRRVGQFVPAGTALLMVYKAERLSPEHIGQLRGTFDFGSSRTMQQDVEFGVLQIVDIALKAISPAVNDPTTAISCIDHLSRLVIRFTSREMPEPFLYDLKGVARVHIRWIDLERLLDSTFEQIRMYSTMDVAVSMRLLRAFGDTAASTPDTTIREILLERAKRVVAGCEHRMGVEELKPMRIRLTALQKLTTAGVRSSPPDPAPPVQARHDTRS